MASMTLKQVPEKLLARLREDAARQRRSVNQHALFLLEHALEERPAPFWKVAESFREDLGTYGDEFAKALEGARDRSSGRDIEL